jgi:hypothetical protein
MSLSIFGNFVAVFCVWLTVQVVNDRKGPSREFLATTMVLIVIGRIKTGHQWALRVRVVSALPAPRAGGRFARF